MDGAERREPKAQPMTAAIAEEIRSAADAWDARAEPAASAPPVQLTNAELYLMASARAFAAEADACEKAELEAGRQDEWTTDRGPEYDATHRVLQNARTRRRGAAVDLLRSALRTYCRTLEGRGIEIAAGTATK